jgi:signal transduction histidine kinase
MDTHETKVYIAILIAAAILGIFLIYFIITIIGHQRRNQLLNKEKINAEITTLEKERTRIASDLHDDLGPMLSTVKLLINNLEIESDEDKITLSKVNGYIDGVLTQLRTISNNLMPQVLGRKGLVAAINEFIDELNATRDMQIHFAPSADLVIPMEQGNHLYRIMHEIIHNAGKHSIASSMDISLEQQENRLVLTMRDNGRGFDPQDLETVRKGLGLKNIMSRVEAIQGVVYLKSAPKTGTEYTIEIPRIKSL